MSLKENNSEKNLSGTGDLGSLSRQQLKELEAREKSGFQKALDWIIMILPVICGIISILEYKFIPDGITNRNPQTYLGALIVLIAAYIIYFLVACFQHCFFCWADMII